MKYIFLALTTMVSPAVMAVQMEGFGANYYQDDSSIPNYETNKGLTPDIIVGDNIFTMEFSSLADIAKTTGVAVNQGVQASWLCLTSKKVNYWFISDNEMGQGYLTSIGIAKTGAQEGCSSYSGDLIVTIKGIPLLKASSEDISSIFSIRPDSNIIQYCADTKSYGDFSQTNCLQYYLENKRVNGVFISQVTSN